MATREAAIRVSLRHGAFNSDLRNMQTQVRTAGSRMGAALRAPMSAGLSAVKKSLGGMGSQLKNTIKMAATLGGALAAGAMVKKAVELQTKFRDISFLLSRIPSQAMDWKEVQDMISTSAAKTGQETMDMANAFENVYSATGNLQYAKDVIDSIGVSATATGKTTEQLATIAQMIERKWGATGDTMQDMMARFIEKTDRGGLSFDGLSGRFDAMAGEASAAGLSGAEGISKLLGTIEYLDARMGTKATPALMTFLQYVRNGTTQLNRLEKAGKFKFEADATPLEKLRKILSSEKMRKISMEVFTETAGGAVLEFAKPFYAAYNEALDARKSEKEAVNAGIVAYDKMVKGINKSEYSFENLQKSFESRMTDDPAVQLRQAIDKISNAFAQPKMIDAIGKLADNLPVLADKIVSLVSFIVDNPITSAELAMGGNIGGSFVGGYARDAIARRSSGADAALGQVARTGGKTAASVGGLGRQADIAAGSIKKVGPSAMGVVSKLGIAVLAAGVISEQLRNATKNVVGGTENTQEYVGEVADRQRATKTVDEKFSIFKEVQFKKEEMGKSLIEKTRESIDEGGSLPWSEYMSAASKGFYEVASTVTGNAELAPSAIEGRQYGTLTRAQTDAGMDVRNQMVDELKSAGKLSGQWIELLFDPLKDLTSIMAEFKRTMKDVNQETSTGASRGPSKVSNSKPGSEPRRG